MYTQPSQFSHYHRRLFFIHGKTQDEFCLPDLLILRLEEVLHRHLDAMGYLRILFFNGRQKLYFYDERSKALIRPPNGSSAAKPSSSGAAKPRTIRMCAGPLGQKRLRRNRSQTAPTQAATSPSPDQPLHMGRMGDLEMVGLMDHCMKDETIPTAVLFTDGLDFINHTEPSAVRQMAACINQWNALFAGNRNICLLIMPDLDVANIRQLLGNSPDWRFLLAKMFNHQERPTKRMISVGPPRADEVANRIHHFRLRNQIPTDWDALPQAIIAVTHRLCAADQGLKTLSVELSAYRALRRDDLKQLAGITDAPSAWERLRELKGLETVAAWAERFIALQKETQAVAKQAESQASPGLVERLAGQPKPSPGVQRNLHLVLQGNPGTGKTTAAKLIGEILRDEGLLELGHTVKASREDLVAEYVGQTAIRTAAKVEQAQGGVLFMDEAYRLSEGGETDFGKEAVETVMEAMSNQMGRFAVVIAGYPELIQSFLDANPGLRRRFGPHNVITIPDYEPAVLQHIFKSQVREHNRRVDGTLEKQLTDFFVNWYEDRDPVSFGNAGDVINLYEAADANRAMRVMHANVTDDARFTLIAEDFPEALQPYLQTASALADRLEKCLRALDRLVGLARVKKLVRTMINRLKIQKLRGGEAGLAPGHYLFTGNPGTGKTTVARMMGEMLHALGILKKGHLVETGRSDLVAGYQGQTALKTREVLERSLDGVLFIDEAYQLVEDERDSFGREALETLVAFMENHKDRLCIIAAGYPEPMHRFVNQNPGLPSRFSGEIMFDNYSAQEMLDIFKLMAEDAQMTLAEGVETHLLTLFQQWAAQAGPTFGNAREVENFLGVMLNRQADRLAGRIEFLDADDRERLHRLEAEDIPIM